MRTLILRTTLGVVAAFQIGFGALFLIAPNFYGSMVGLAPVPDWAPWMFAMFSARAFGFAAGMIVAIREPERHRAWIAIMIGVQALDWLATMALVINGTLTLPQVSTAAFMPVLFIVSLLVSFPRRPIVEKLDAAVEIGAVAR
jgi:hypothetical protein